MSSSPNWFGRGRELGIRKRATEVMYDVLYAGAWPARLAWRIGAQGRFGVSTHRLTLPGRDPDRPPLRIAFASDFHAGPGTAPRLLAESARALHAARADLLLLGGDFVSFHARHLRPLLPHLAAITAPMGKFAVLGNHDLVGDDRWIAERLEEAGVRVLVNANARLPAPHDDLWVCGLDDPGQGHPDADRAFAGADGIRLLLMHSPDGLTAVGDRPFALGFCGHVHGGQFWASATRPLVTHKGPWSARYMRGGLVAPRGDAPSAPRLLISRGIGMGNFPLRRGADPEVHVVEIEGREA